MSTAGSSLKEATVSGQVLRLKFDARADGRGLFHVF